ncbi:hypothetical protein A9K97_gp110 [Tokyovirus A1]|uniref:hypothetical protein n=1 Tax=Tokyovirus A1 TaxID=1826170 RepID=UPI0007A95D89|nr:hypothetical protein A9K97_gp110 [Tokyovirus A1]BAU80241.1 hypothetical protein [Tokyovirus A1]
MSRNNPVFSTNVWCACGEIMDEKEILPHLCAHRRNAEYLFSDDGGKFTCMACKKETDNVLGIINHLQKEMHKGVVYWSKQDRNSQRALELFQEKFSKKVVEEVTDEEVWLYEFWNVEDYLPKGENSEVFCNKN